MKIFATITFSLFIILSPWLPASTSDGGFLHAGLRGEYFSNETLSGSPDFTRREPRIDFSLEADRSPGGSNSPAHKNFPATNYSARWSGQFVPRFSETYTFHFSADDGVVLSIKPATSATWVELINQWSTAGEHSGTASLAADQVYDIQISYRQSTGSAEAKLEWSSPNTPRQLIEPTFEISHNWGTYAEQTFANAILSGRNRWENTTIDADGWPEGDGSFIVSEILQPFDISPIETGYMQLRFNGSADVAVQGNGSLVPDSYSYDAAQNLSTATIIGQDNNGNVLSIRLTNTSRDGSGSVNDGVTNVSLMRPSAPNATTSLAEGTLFYPSFIEACSRLTAMRYQRANDQAQEWADRTLPNWPYQIPGRDHPYVYQSRYDYTLTGETRMAHEMEIMLCNELGCDYYVCIPHLASTSGTNSYVRKLARLIKYGSDANGEPYSSPQINPAYPPLNSNLRVYVEISNELWNSGSLGSYPPYWDYRELVEDLADANDPLFQNLNFDNLPLTQQADDYHTNNFIWVKRYWGHKIVEVSNALRVEFGDAAMPGTSDNPRIRPYYGWQYANANDTTREPLEFIDNFYNNSSHVSDPHSVSYYLYAGGGAGYFGSANATGQLEDSVLNASFEFPAVTDDTATPDGATWSFEGTAGISPNKARNATLTSETLGTLRNDLNGWVGMEFTVGAQDIAVYELGRYHHSGNSRNHATVIVRASDLQRVTWSAEIGSNIDGSYAWENCIPVRLEANTTYYLLTEEHAGYDTFADDSTSVSSDPAIQINASISASRVVETDVWTVQRDRVGSFSTGPVNLKYTTAIGLQNPDTITGLQCAYIQGIDGSNGSMEIELTAPEGSTSQTYSLAFRGVQRTKSQSGTPDQQELRITVDGADISYTSIGANPQEYNPIFPWQRIVWWIGQYFFTETFTIPTDGSVILRIEGISTSGDQACFLDDFNLTSVDALFEAGVPDTGEANGQPTGGDYTQTIRADGSWATHYGLKYMTYEHGWSIGGDSGASPLQDHAKYQDPRAADAMEEMLNIFHQAGGHNLTLGTYTTWPRYSEALRQEGMLNSASWPLVQGWDRTAARAPSAPNNGAFLPANLPISQVSLSQKNPGNTLHSNQWVSWNIISEENSSYSVSSTISGSGTIRVSLDDGDVIYEGVAQNLNESFTTSAGQHSIKVKCLSGSITLNTLHISPENTPTAPVLLSAADGDGQVQLSWNSVTGATGYQIRYGIRSNQLDQSVTLHAAVTDFILGSLSNGTQYYFQIHALNTNGRGLPSNELSSLPFGANDHATIVTFDFHGGDGDDATASPTLSSARASTSNLTRGAGFTVTGWAPANCFVGGSDAWATNLVDAVTNEHFVEFTITPAATQHLALSNIRYRPSFQNTTGEPADMRGTGVAWKVGDGSWSTPVPVIGTRTGSFAHAPLFSFDVSTITELQDVTEPISFRFYYHGMNSYEAGGIGGEGNDIEVIGSLSQLPLDAWRSRYQLPLDGSQDNATPADDGIPNIQKYAFNLIPENGDLSTPIHNTTMQPNGTTGLPTLIDENDQIHFQFIRRRATTQPSLNYVTKVSQDLSQWDTTTDIPTVEIIDDTWERVTFSYPTDSLADKTFFQISLE